MVIRNSAHCVEVVEVVLVGVVITVPRNYIKRTVALLVHVHLSTETSNDSPLNFALINVASDGSLEISFVCETVRSNGTKVGNHKMSRVNLSYPTTTDGLFIIDRAIFVD